jgi:hypothetical protein
MQWRREKFPVAQNNKMKHTHTPVPTHLASCDTVPDMPELTCGGTDVMEVVCVKYHQNTPKSKLKFLKTYRLLCSENRLIIH